MNAMRLSKAIKLVTVVGICSSLVSICLWSSCGTQQSRDLRIPDDGSLGFEKGSIIVQTKYSKRGAESIGEPHGGSKVEPPPKVQDGGSCHLINCSINGEETIPCRKDGAEVYMPFSFVKTYFEVFGDVTQRNGKEKFEFYQANSIVHPPQPTYTPGSMFMAFDYYNVETRDRVKCVTATEGVPITTQWSKEGYHYPIQVAQYGLSHHAKHIVKGDPDVVVLEDAEEDATANFEMPDRKSTVKIVKSDTSKNSLVEFFTSDSLKTKGIALKTDGGNKLCITMDIKFASNGSIIVLVETGTQEVYKIHYVFTNDYVTFDGKSNIYYGLGERKTKWIHLARDLKVDLLKGFLCKIKKDKLKASRYVLTKVLEVRLHGHGLIDNLTLSTTVHMDQFYDAANWLVKHQDDRGGWPIMVQRRLVAGVMELPPGWYSAMGQGQAMSVLVRAYLLSKNEKYLKSAIEALKLFEVNSDQGGVRAKFLGILDWYEEYPTIPSSFVLNGFIYSLLGLYDLKETATGEGYEAAKRIFDSGMNSLKKMIGMYDSGVGTLYDLRHITAGIDPNRARWDYHTTHINQILQLIVIDDDPIFKSTVQRWLGYLKGKKSRHN